MTLFSFIMKFPKSMCMIVDKCLSCVDKQKQTQTANVMTKWGSNTPFVNGLNLLSSCLSHAEADLSARRVNFNTQLSLLACGRGACQHASSDFRSHRKLQVCLFLLKKANKHCGGVKVKLQK